MRPGFGISQAWGRSLTVWPGQCDASFLGLPGGGRQGLVHVVLGPLCPSSPLPDSPSWWAPGTNPKSTAKLQVTAQRTGNTFRARLVEESLLLVKNWGLETEKSGFKPWLCHLPAQCPWPGCLTSSRLHFLICKIAIQVASTYITARLGDNPHRGAWHTVGVQ